MKSSAFLSIAVFSLAVAVSGTAAANEMYFLGSVGPSKTDGNSSNGTSVKLQLGYQLSPTIAVEGGYVDAGTQKFSFGSLSVDAKMSGGSVAVLGLIPFGERLSMFGKFGYNSYTSSVSVGGYSGVGSGNISGALVGVGGKFKLSDTLAVRVEYEKIASDTALTTVGLQLRF
ncbi:MAG: outer membrane beta-barrel protein [Candidatus Methylumidiphilus sp.]